MKISCYIPKRVIRTNHNEAIIRPSEIRSTLVSRKREVHVISEDKDYTTLIVSKSKITQSSSVSNPTLIVNKCSNVILSKFKAVKFILE